MKTYILQKDYLFAMFEPIAYNKGHLLIENQLDYTFENSNHTISKRVVENCNEWFKLKEEEKDNSAFFTETDMRYLFEITLCSVRDDSIAHTSFDNVMKKFKDFKEDI